MTTIGLCMIVKDESRIIERCLNSVRPLIDYVLICDTGSTDNTQSKIRQWLHRTGLSGRVINRTWIDFGTNRSVALQFLRESDFVDYALMMDADDQLVIDPGLDIAAWKASLIADMYDVLIEHGPIRHWRPQIFSNCKEFCYRGVLHEFVEGPPGHTRGRAEGLRILAGVEGHRSSDPDKYRKDAGLLARAMATETDEVLRQRYAFYLAQSHKDAGDNVVATIQYMDRAEMGGWEGEVYVSLYQAAQLMETLPKATGESIIGKYLRAFEADPSRAESLRAAVRYCHRTGRHHQGYLIGRHGITIPQPTDAKLFLEPWVYEWGMHDDFSVAAYWAGHYRESFDSASKALQHAPDDHSARIVDNIRFAKEKLYGSAATNIGGSLDGTLVGDLNKIAGKLDNLATTIKDQIEYKPKNPQIILDDNHIAGKKLDGSNRQDGTEGTMKICDGVPDTISNSGTDIRDCSPNHVDFTIVSVEASGYIHSGAYAELAETVMYGLRALGYKAVLSHDLNNLASETEKIIAIGAHLISTQQLPANVIIYNTEHFSNVGDDHISGGYRRMLREHRGQVWDYSLENSRQLAEMLGRSVKYVPVGYAPEMTRIMPAEEQDIDVLFYGSLNERRNKILDDLRAAGLKVEYFWGVYGLERDKYIARAKIVLSMHYYTPGVFEAVRVSYLLANKKVVVCEDDEFGEADDAGACETTYHELVDTCCTLLNMENIDREIIADENFETFSIRHERDILRTALRHKVRDCFLYNGEVDVLAIRLHELKDVVDQFVVVESDTTFSGQSKDPRSMWIGSSDPRLVALRDVVKDKITHIMVKNMPTTADPWERERHQRNAITRGLTAAAPDDLVIISDVDEIPRADVVREMANNLRHEVFGLRLAFHYFFLNYRCTSGPEVNKIWNCAVTKRLLDTRSPDSIRYLVHAYSAFTDSVTTTLNVPYIIGDAGWHFSYLGDDEMVRNKIRAFSHQEYNTPEVLDVVDIDKMVGEGKDLFGRPGYGWRLVGTKDLPEWVKSQPELMEKLVR